MLLCVEELWIQDLDKSSVPVFDRKLAQQLVIFIPWQCALRFLYSRESIGIAFIVNYM